MYTSYLHVIYIFYNQPIRGIFWVFDVQISLYIESMVWYLDSTSFGFFPKRITIIGKVSIDGELIKSCVEIVRFADKLISLGSGMIDLVEE